MSILIKPVSFPAIGFATLLSLMAGPTFAFGDQWYFGLGGGISQLEPNPVQPLLGVENNQGSVASVFFGVDLDNQSSAQLQLYSLGEAELDNAEMVPFTAIDGSILYRLYDSRDRSTRTGTPALSFYGRFGLGYMDRDTDVPLKDDSSVYFGIGAGLEAYLTHNVALRFEGFYHESNAGSATLSLVTRFGGSAAPTRIPRATPPQPAPNSNDTAVADIPSANVENMPAATLPETPVITSGSDALEAPALPSLSEVPSVPRIPTVPAIPPVTTTPTAPVAPPLPLPQSPGLANDADADGVADAVDQCLQSPAGSPVLETGCAVFDGVLTGVQFKSGNAVLLQESYLQLDYLANLLQQYPQARVEVKAHTDDSGTVRSQAILTRSRLRTIGTYLLKKGVRSNQLVLRSFGGAQPLYDNNDAQGRIANNRIEVSDHQP